MALFLPLGRKFPTVLFLLPYISSFLAPFSFFLFPRFLASTIEPPIVVSTANSTSTFHFLTQVLLTLTEYPPPALRNDHSVSAASRPHFVLFFASFGPRTIDSRRLLFLTPFLAHRLPAAAFSPFSARSLCLSFPSFVVPLSGTLFAER